MLGEGSNHRSVTKARSLTRASQESMYEERPSYLAAERRLQPSRWQIEVTARCRAWLSMKTLSVLNKDNQLLTR